MEEVRWDGSRAFLRQEYRSKSIEVVWHCRSASARPFGCFDGSAAADLPGLRPFRRGCKRFAQERVVRSMLLLETSFAFPTMIPEARGTLWLADRLAGGLAGLAWREGGLAGGLAGTKAAECLYLRRKTHIQRI